MAEPLELSYNWPFRLAAVTVTALACIVLLALTGTSGWQTVAAFVVLLWVLVGGSIYLRARAFLRVEGSELTVRRFRSKHTISGPQVLRVTEYITRQGAMPQIDGTNGDRQPAVLGADRAVSGWTLDALRLVDVPRASGRTGQGFCQNAGAIAKAWTDRVRRSGMRNRRD